ncbi:MAG: hypothetical protein CEO12_147 [Parcubacteria group bacterium Gr01-1014_46]|nr:MAG: hypothetical protein CEO12_147 [Parcubacteria group bacterium Gr01-1014_46]
MDVSLLTLKILSIYLVVSGLFLLFKQKSIPHLLNDFFGHPATVYLTGVILVFLSSMYLIQYNLWDGTWKTLVTLFAWLVLVKGLVYIFAPKTLSEGIVRKYRGFFGFYGVAAILVGAYLFFLK